MKRIAKEIEKIARELQAKSDLDIDEAFALLVPPGGKPSHLLGVYLRNYTTLYNEFYRNGNYPYNGLKNSGNPKLLMSFLKQLEGARYPLIKSAACV